MDAIDIYSELNINKIMDKIPYGVKKISLNNYFKLIDDIIKVNGYYVKHQCMYRRSIIDQLNLILPIELNLNMDYELICDYKYHEKFILYMSEKNNDVLYKLFFDIYDDSYLMMTKGKKGDKDKYIVKGKTIYEYYSEDYNYGENKNNELHIMELIRDIYYHLEEKINDPTKIKKIIKSISNQYLERYIDLKILNYIIEENNEESDESNDCDNSEYEETEYTSDYVEYDENN